MACYKVGPKKTFFFFTTGGLFPKRKFHFLYLNLHPFSFAGVPDKSCCNLIYLLNNCAHGRLHNVLKGILHQKKFYRLNLIFWIVMGCGIAHFGRRRLFSHKCQIFICHNSTRMVA